MVVRNKWNYKNYKSYLEHKFPGRIIRKLCLDAGFTCPNIDGKISRGGCTYCNNQGFAPRVTSSANLIEQWEKGKVFLRKRYKKVDAFIAYFQSFSNTYSSVDHLRSIYDMVLDKLSECIGISISTRPDCFNEEIVAYIKELAKKTFLTIELGLQTDDDQILRKINRGHDSITFMKTVERLCDENIDLCVHFILGLPGESKGAPERLGKLAARLPIETVKIHNLHIMHGTHMHKQFIRGKVNVISEDEYLDAVCCFISQLRPDQYVQRIVADAPARLLVSSPWCHNKQRFLGKVKERL